MNYDHNKKFGLLKFNSGYGTFYLNSPKGYSRKIINAQTGNSRLQNMQSALPYALTSGMESQCIYKTYVDNL